MSTRRLRAVLLLALVPITLSSTMAAPLARRALTLARGGQPVATIVLAKEPTKRRSSRPANCNDACSR